MFGKRRGIALTAGMVFGAVLIGAVWGAQSRAASQDAVRYVPVAERASHSEPEAPSWLVRACMGPAQIDMDWRAPAQVLLGGPDCAGSVLSASIVKLEPAAEELVRLGL